MWGKCIQPLRGSGGNDEYSESIACSTWGRNYVHTCSYSITEWVFNVFIFCLFCVSMCIHIYVCMYMHVFMYLYLVCLFVNTAPAPASESHGEKLHLMFC